jgi:hypothetical protein
MSRDERLRKLLTGLKERGLLGKVVVIQESDESRQRHEEINQYLADLKRFEDESRRRGRDIIVGGSGCGYCHSVHHYPNYC